MTNRSSNSLWGPGLAREQKVGERERRCSGKGNMSMCIGDDVFNHEGTISRQIILLKVT
jgi:hypothetical protein